MCITGADIEQREDPSTIQALARGGGAVGPLQFEVGGVAIVVKFGDLLAEADADVLVNAANERLLPGGGVCGALHAAAGPGLAEECAAHVAESGPLGVGGAVITTGGELPNAWIIHAVGPIYGREDARLLETAYRSALAVAEAAGLATIACPLLAAGIYGHPVPDALDHALRGIRDYLADGHPTTLREIRLVLRNPAHLPAAHAAVALAFSRVPRRSARQARGRGPATGTGSAAAGGAR